MIYVCFVYYAACNSSGMDKYSSAKCLLYSDIVIFLQEEDEEAVTKKAIKYFTTFFYLFFFFNYFTLFYFCEVHLLKVGRVFASSTRYAVLNALITTCHGNLQIDITRNGEGQSGQESEEKAERKWLVNGWRWWTCGRRWSNVSTPRGNEH